MKKEVQDTAFMIAHYRAQHEGVSKDPYAKLWLTDTNLKPWADDFEEKVSEHDELLHCLRNRYFYDTLKQLTREEPETLFVNLGAGFSMYPYVLPKQTSSIEIELPQIAAHKAEKVNAFKDNGILPTRNVLHIAKNITDEQQHSDIIELVNRHKKNKTVFLIEGVFFFLNKKEIASVISLCKQIQAPGDVLLCVSFEQALANAEVFRRLKAYFTEVLDTHGNPFTTLSHSYFKEIEGYDLKTCSSTLTLGKELSCFPKDFDDTLVLDEQLYHLVRC